MILLTLDTSSNLCAASVHDSGAGELGRAVRDIGKGHAEQLMDVIGEALAASGRTYADLGAVAVAVGPGSFTGIRVGVSAARGLALALGVPSTGVSTLHALAQAALDEKPGRSVMAAIDARRDELYVATFDADGRPLTSPAVLLLADAAALAAPGIVLTGSGAQLVSDAAGGGFEIVPGGTTADISVIARLALRQGFDGPRPKPLYLRGSGAKPQENFAVARR